jgi:hypothetical protein
MNGISNSRSSFVLVASCLAFAMNSFLFCTLRTELKNGSFAVRKAVFDLQTGLGPIRLAVEGKGGKYGLVPTTIDVFRCRLDP